MSVNLLVTDAKRPTNFDILCTFHYSSMLPELNKYAQFSSIVCTKPHKDIFKWQPGSQYSYNEMATNRKCCSFTNLLDQPSYVTINKTQCVVKERKQKSTIYVQTLKCLRHILQLFGQWLIISLDTVSADNRLILT